jgi:pimeloyl-ACP methyl ester carboxylesterase
MKFRWLMAVVAAVLANGCGAFRPATAPIRTVTVHESPENRCLAVLLTGRYAAPEEFARGGFGAAVAQRGLPLDVVAVDAHLGYYRTRSVVERIRKDVVLPAKARGYEEIWLAGTSLGGLGTLIYHREHPEDLKGILAIAPFLGEDEVITEIEAAGGPALWRAPASAEGDDIGRTIWSWLASAGFASQTDSVSLGWGTEDRFDRSNRLMAGLLDPEQVYAVSGGHDMATWNSIWGRFLDRVEPCRR